MFSPVMLKTGNDGDLIRLPGTFVREVTDKGPACRRGKLGGLVVFEISYKEGLTSNVYSVKLDLEATLYVSFCI